MRLTKREKVLLLLLLFVIGGYFIFQYIVTPQLAALTELKQDLAQWEARKQDLSTVDQTMERLGADKDTANVAIQTIGNQYFASLERQEEAIIVLNELLQGTGCTDSLISFETLSTEMVPEGSTSSVVVQRARLQFEGSYDSAWSLLRAIWNFSKFIEITDLSVSQPDTSAPDVSTDLLTWEVGLNFYDLSQMTHVSDELVQWFESGTFRKANPFSVLSNEVFPGTRYFLNRDDTDTNKYVKFADIIGNWAEEAIDNFGRKHLISGDEGNCYSPDSAMTRGEFVVLLDKVFQWETPDQPIDLTTFSDYSELGQSESAMEKAFYKGYLKNYFQGFDDGTLRPNAPTTYTEFELVMRRVLDQPDYQWNTTAEAIQQQTSYHSPGLENKDAYISRAEVVYFLNTITQ